MSGKREKRKRKKNGRSEWRYRGQRGVVTVFVVLIMVPVVVFTSIMVDLARWKMYSSQAVMAADSYGDAVLSEYDNLLKDLYGLFSITQNEEGKAALEEYAKYAKYSFNPKGDGSSLAGFMPYANAEVEIGYEPAGSAAEPGKAAESSLDNPDVLMSQINEFMEFRAIGGLAEGVMESFGLLDSLDQVSKMGFDSKAVESRQKLTESSNNIWDSMKSYYDALSCLENYPEYCQGRGTAYEAYRAGIKAILDSDKYKEYCYYLDNKEAIDAAVKAAEDAAKALKEDDENREKAKKKAEEEDEDDSDETDSEEVTLLSDEERKALENTRDSELAKKKVDVTQYRKDFKNDIKSVQDAAKNHGKGTSYKIDFDSVNQKKKDLHNSAEDVTKEMREMAEQVDYLQGEDGNSGILANCTSKVETKIKDDIKDIGEITKDLEIYPQLDNWIGDSNYLKQSGDYNDKNKTMLNSALDALDDVFDAITEYSGGSKSDSIQTQFNNTQATLSWTWKDFKKEADYADHGTYVENIGLYNKLAGIWGDSSDGNKKFEKPEEQKKAEENLKKAEQQKEELEKEDEALSLKDISPEVAKEMWGEAGERTVGKKEGYHFADVFSADGGMKVLKDAGTGLVSKFLLTSYDFGMFSSRVTGIEPPDEGTDEEAGEAGAGETEEEYADYSLTKVKMSPKVNYLYGAEMEYIFAGNKSSKENLATARNTIISIRATTNFISTFTIQEVNDAIVNISNLAGDAAGAASGPAYAVVRTVVYIAVNGALRAAFAAFETVADWKELTQRKGVVLLKNDLDELTSKDLIEDLLNIDLSGGPESSSSVEMPAPTYEDYLTLLIFVFTDRDLMLMRTSDLITLNVNQAQQKTAADAELATPLAFKMKDTVTAIKSTCKVKAEFAVLPDSFAKMFLEGSSVEAGISSIEDEYFGYSVIRGY